MITNEQNRSALVVTHNRPELLPLCLTAIAPQADLVLVIDNASTPPAVVPPELSNVWIVRDEEQPPNLSRLWNLGLDFLAMREGVDTEDVAVLNDDAIAPPGWFDTVATQMRRLGAAAGCTNPTLGESVVHGPSAPFCVATRLSGWAFVLRGEVGLRADERLRWWCGDDDLSAKARHNGGLVHVPGQQVDNRAANTSTVGVLAEQAARDMQTFVDIWGRRPW